MKHSEHTACFSGSSKLPLCEGNVVAMRDNKADCQITGSIAIQEMFPHQTASSLTGVVLAPGYSPLYAWELFQGRHGKKNGEFKWGWASCRCRTLALYTYKLVAWLILILHYVVCALCAKDYGDGIWVKIFKILPKGKNLWNPKFFTSTD